jgi:feruloyl-CoA synthase
MYTGVPYVPIAPAYSLQATEYSALRHLFAQVAPALVFAAEGAPFDRALREVLAAGAELVVATSPGDRPSTPFAELADTPARAAVDEAHGRVHGDTVAKLLFTSGSTGRPKGVINTQRMLCSNQKIAATVFSYFEDEPPVFVEWAPWHHTAAGNKVFGMALYNGGSYYIDEGKPLPGAIETTVRNLREIAPTWYFNVPRGFEALLPYLREDEALRKRFFSRVKVLWFAAAALPQHVYDAYNALAYDTCGETIPFLTGFGATETAPHVLGRLWPTDDVSNMGVPPPGVEAKLAPLADKFELRVKGPGITPGYWRQPELTAVVVNVKMLPSGSTNT